MDMQAILNIVQLVLGVFLIIAILLQSRGAGLSGTFGGDSAVYTTRRGPEKFLYWLTVVLAVIFVGLAILSLILR